MQNYYVEPQETKDGVPATVIFDLQHYDGKMVSAYAHMHDKIELLYCVSGSFRALLNGKEFFFGTGDILLINSHEIHQVWSETDGDNSYMVLKLEPELLYNSSQAIFEMKYVLPFTLSHSTHPKLFRSSQLAAGNIPPLLFEIEREYSEQKYAYELAIRACICRLFLWILRYWSSQGFDLNMHNDISEKNMVKLQSVLDYVGEYYSRDISVADMAAMCNMSYSYFSRQFKQIMNRSFSDYLTHVRIFEAEKLLTSTSLNITEVAREVGFSDAGYFIQKFKQLKGISPKKFKTFYTGAPV